jgi:hypothetical protein
MVFEYSILMVKKMKFIKHRTQHTVLRQINGRGVEPCGWIEPGLCRVPNIFWERGGMLKWYRLWFFYMRMHMVGWLSNASNERFFTDTPYYKFPFAHIKLLFGII